MQVFSPRAGDLSQPNNNRLSFEQSKTGRLNFGSGDKCTDRTGTVSASPVTSQCFMFHVSFLFSLYNTINCEGTTVPARVSTL